MHRGLFLVSRTLHAWGAVTVSLLILLASLTGTLLVWKDDYLRLAYPEARQTSFQPDAQALARVGEAVESHWPADEVLLLRFATERLPLNHVTLTRDRFAWVDMDGRIVDEWVLNERWTDWLFDLHHRLLLENLGLTVLGLAALATIVLVLAGVIAYWPARRGWRLGLWPRGGGRNARLATHRNLGILLALPLTVMLATGALLAFPQQAEEWLLEPFRDEDYSMDFVDGLDEVSGDGTGDWLPALQRTLDAFPGSRIRTARVPDGFMPYRIIGVQQPGEFSQLGLSMTYIDAEGGWMDIRIDPLNQHLSERLYNLAYPLHTGRQDTLAYRLLLTLVGAGTAVLAAVGLWCFVRRWIRPRGNAPRRRQRRAARDAT